jgi:energy-coupling factor transport system ATP-binding protein
MIEFHDVSFEYEDGKWAVENLKFSLDKGQFVSVIGGNGSGKSTIARLTNGLLLPQKGKIYVDSVPTDDPHLANSIKAKVGIVFQNPDNQFIGMTVEEDIAFGLENLNFNWKEAHQRVMEVSKLLGIEKYLPSPPSFLSGGEKQKVAIAGALVLTPEYLVLDEVTSLLDPVGRKEILLIVKSLVKSQGIGVLYITHNTDEIVDSDYIIAIKKGKIVTEGKVKEVFDNVEYLHSIGVSVPGDIYVSYYLKKRGLLGSDVFFENEIIEKLC